MRSLPSEANLTNKVASQNIARAAFSFLLVLCMCAVFVVLRMQNGVWSGWNANEDVQLAVSSSLGNLIGNSMEQL